MFSSFPYACCTFRIMSELTVSLTSFPWFYPFLPLSRQNCNFTCTLPIFLYFKSLKTTCFASVSIHYSPFSWKWYYIKTEHAIKDHLLPGGWIFWPDFKCFFFLVVLGQILKHGSLLLSTSTFRICNNIIYFVRRFITKESINNPTVSHIINLCTCNEIIILICVY
jgi:hypothetical protein